MSDNDIPLFPLVIKPGPSHPLITMRDDGSITIGPRPMWISVKDHLPDCGIGVRALVVDSGGLRTHALATLSSDTFNSNVAPGWRLWYHFGTIDLTVTHWSPLEDPSTFPPLEA